MSIEIFTFWNGDSLFAVEVSSILSTQQYNNDEKPLPVKGKGLKGALMYRSQPTPLFDFSEVVGLPSPFEENKKLINMLHDRESDHVNWLNALENTLVNDVPFEKAIDPHKCEFGRWYDNFNTRDQDLSNLLKQFKEPHERIHGLANELIKMNKAGQKQQALTILNNEREMTLSRMIRLFDGCRRELTRLCRPVVMFVTKDGNTPLLGLIINQIDDVQEIENDEILSLENLSVGSIILNDEIAPLVKGFVSRKNIECLLLEPQRLLEVA